MTAKGSDYGLVKSSGKACPIHLVCEDHWTSWLAEQSKSTQSWTAAMGFKPTVGSHMVAPDEHGAVGLVAVVIDADGPNMWTLAALVDLPAGRYKLATKYDTATATGLALGWALAQYQYDTFTTKPERLARLMIPARANMDEVCAVAAAIHMGRTLVNLPANHMSPADLELAAYRVAEGGGAKVKVITGNDLIRKKFPAIHAVGRASAVPPRLIDFKWGRTKAPKVTLVGKGVTFDTGGLDIKPSSAMRMMRKDMGGAASVLALAQMIMALHVDVRLRVLIPAVENSVSGNSFRPGDILDTRLGKTVEVGNTDAEGRLILSDALTYADEDHPEVIIDMATLTGAARVALGAQLPALFTNSDALADGLTDAATLTDDPLWRLPLWANYRPLLNSRSADLCNISSGSFGGAITAALFMEHFVSKTTQWAHIDTYAWNDTARPGRPAGGEVLAVRAIYAYLVRRFGVQS